MQCWIKVLTIPFILLFTLSLYGCGIANVDQSKEKVVNITDGAAPSENKLEQPKKDIEATSPSPSKGEAQTEQYDKQDDLSAQPPADSGQGKTSEEGKKNPIVSNNSAPSANVTTKSSEPKKAVSPVASKPVNSNHTATLKQQPKTEPVSTVSLSIKGPKDYGMILSDSNVSMKNGELILTVLQREANARKFHVDYRGSGATAYVRGLEDKGGKWSFYEFDYGAASGWVFKVNGVSLTQSIGITSIKEGDRIECIYTE